MSLFAPLLKPLLRLLVRPTALPAAPASAHNLDAQQPLAYAVRSSSRADLLTLQRQCLQLGLPDPLSPLTIKGETLPRVYWLNNPGCSQTSASCRPALTRLLQLHAEDPQLAVQLVPAAVLWGRDAPRAKGSLLTALLLHDNPGHLRKLWMVLLLGRACFIRFSRPLAVRTLVDQQGASERTAHTLERVARVHFHRTRLMATGPQLADRALLFEQILRAPLVAKAMAEECASRNQSPAAVKAQALGYLDEIAANYSNTLIRLLDLFMTWLWNRIYRGIHVQHAERVRELAQAGYELIYVPCHRSHMDYLLLSYVLYYQGLVPPHIAAGVNLNFWPAGPIFRRGGAFFMRRSFKGNKLYATVFREYLAELFERGYSVEYFTEGGRSRTGRLLPPKTGMLAMTVQAVLRGGIHRPLALVPIYLGYEHVMEIGTYMKELRGATKEKESAWQVLGAIRKLRNFGHGYVNFGSPLLLQPFLQQHAPQWREALGREEGFKPSWLTPSVNLLAEQLMAEINNAAAINAMNLVALVLLATPQHQLSRQALERQLQLLLTLAKEAPYHANVSLPGEEPSALVDHILAMEKIHQRHDHAGALIYSSAHEAIQLSYYRNNILHLYIMPSLLAASLLNHPQQNVASVRTLLHRLYPLLQGELFIGWSTSELDRQLDQLLLLFCQQGLIQQQGEQLQPAEADHLERGTLALLARVALETLLRLGVVLTQLRHAPEKARAELEQQSQVVALRLAEMHGIHAPEFLDRKVFASLIQGLRSEGYFDNDDGDSARLIALQQQVMDLLPAEMANTVLEVCASGATQP